MRRSRLVGSLRARRLCRAHAQSSSPQSLACRCAEHHQTWIVRRDSMGKQFVLSAVVVLGMGVMGSAFAATQGYSGTAILAKPVAAPAELVVEGVTWRCEGDKCSGTAERRSSLNSFIKDCRKVAEAVGPLVAYT